MLKMSDKVSIFPVKITKMLEIDKISAFAGNSRLLQTISALFNSPTYQFMNHDIISRLLERIIYRYK